MSLSLSQQNLNASAPTPPFLTGHAVRLAARKGLLTTHTAGLAPGFVQGNVAILPRNLASDFEAFCKANPKPCPLLAVGKEGNPFLPTLGADCDIRTDVPHYRLWRDGKVVAEVDDIQDVWRDDLISFVLGCSFSFEDALITAGFAIRHQEEGRNVPMYRTNIACTPKGPFHGPMVVSMRPFLERDVDRVVAITARFPAVHGAPVHIGAPETIGIVDLQRPDFGDAVSVYADEEPVFWACGVTPQSIIMAAKPAFAITHAPGCMLVTDKRNEDYSVNSILTTTGATDA